MPEMELSTAQRTQRLWRELVAACVAAANTPPWGLHTDDIGYVVHELALGLLALQFSQEELVRYLELTARDVANNKLTIPNRIFGNEAPSGTREWSWVATLSGTRDAHPHWRHTELEALLAMRGSAQANGGKHGDT